MGMQEPFAVGGGVGGTRQEVKKKDAKTENAKINGAKKTLLIIMTDVVGLGRRAHLRRKNVPAPVFFSDAGTHEAQLFALLRCLNRFSNAFFATFLISCATTTFVFLIVLFTHNFCCFGVI